MNTNTKRKFVLRPGSRGLKVLLAAMLTLALVALAALQWVRRDLKTLTEEKRGQAAALEQENAQLEEKTAALGSVDSVIDIAQSELGYVPGDAVVIGEK